MTDKGTSWAAQFASWVTAVFGVITLEKFAVIVGICTSVGTFAVNWYYAKKRAEALERAKHPTTD